MPVAYRYESASSYDWYWYWTGRCKQTDRVCVYVCVCGLAHSWVTSATRPLPLLTFGSLHFLDSGHLPERSQLPVKLCSPEISVLPGFIATTAAEHTQTDT